jgi:predicted phosphate transport protein (TIGR00153 family)
VPKIRLIPQNREFFVLFNRAAANMIDISHALHEMLADFPERHELRDRIHDLEHRGDDITHEIVRLLNSTFVTPLDREDIYALATGIDDICDHIDEAADQIVLYGVRRIPEQAVGQAAVIERACVALAHAIEGLDGLRDIHEDLLAVHTLENEGDTLVRAAIAKLFSDGEDALQVIRWKDIHEQLEHAVDCCEKAAHVLESAYLKNR